MAMARGGSRDRSRARGAGHGRGHGRARGDIVAGLWMAVRIGLAVLERACGVWYAGVVAVAVLKVLVVVEVGVAG